MDDSSSRGRLVRSTPTFTSVLQQHRQTYYDGLVSVVLFFVWQLLICGLQQLTTNIDNFPAPILAMMIVAAVMILASKCVPNLDGLYRRYLRRPTDLLNRHMSIGFTVPFTMIMDGPMSSPCSIGLIISGYIIIGILSTALVLALSLGLQTILMSITAKKAVLGNPRNAMVIPPVDLAPPVIPAVRVDSYSSLSRSLQRQASPRPIPTDSLAVLAPPPRQDRVQSYVSESTTLTNNPPSVHSASQNDDTDVEQAASALRLPPLEPPPLVQPPEVAMTTTPSERLCIFAQRVACFAAASPVMCCSLVAIPLVGIPVSVVAHSDTALDTFLLVVLWTGTLATQAAVRRTALSFGLATDQARARARSILATLLNAVLWTSLGTIAYLAVKAAARHHAVGDALSAFSTGTSLADLIAGTRSRAGGRPPRSLGAGDVAAAVLDAGIVSWGLKLFECRAQLLSRAGLTTLAVGAIVAAGNIVCGPLLVHAMGSGLVSPAKQLSFAARSVTLALAGPAMTNLGGDVGLNAAMVVFNGIVFQVAMGLGVCRWASRALVAAEGRWQQCSDAAAVRHGSHRRRQDTPEPGSGSGFRCHMGSGCWRSQSETQSDTDEAETETETESDSISVARPTLVVFASPSPSKGAHVQDVEMAADSTPSSASASAPASRPVSYTKCGDACLVHVHLRGGAASVDDVNALGRSPDMETDSPGTVAAGMTVGINAAAMGTAYLYEVGSRAAPYAALSMTVFGVMTVVFTSIQPLANWVVARVA
ncbi:uncharacterized protein SPSK_07108 [Sporothrix schenckii 1099-18]|uniref:LrgB-like protein n=1 Tax=Sporothrix schenckii 1099-18 TaxID=1397361 RepID=A0A0F2MGX6_SPOSC|nr:uncharacterized protein SPSK_07108 [Sporothrix schenckii 1099-18]KJR88095.1 hypothetical protein SPSK_07108 [Sporothrix schenckii 1099-18]